MNEIKISCRRAWIKYARLGAKSTAKTEMDSWIIEVFGNEEGWQKALLQTSPDQTYWTEKWDSMIYRLKRSVSMDTEYGTNLAIAKMNEVKLVDNVGDPKKVQHFLETFIGCRAKYLEFGLTKLDDANSLKLELEAFKLKITGTALMAFLLKLPDGFPQKMDSADMEEEKLTVFGRTRQFVKAQYDSHPHQKSTQKDEDKPKKTDKPFKKQDTTGGNANARGGQGHFLVTTLKKITEGKR